VRVWVLATVALVDFQATGIPYFAKKRRKIMAESFDFSEEEIRRKLEQLGYSNIPSDKLKLFQRGLLSLISSFKLGL